MVSLRSLFGDDAEMLRQTEFQLLLLSTMLPSLGTSLLSPVLDSLVGPFEASTTSVGLLISAFTAPAIVMIPVAGVLADRYGRKPVLVVSLAGFGLAGGAVALTTDFRVALLLRLLQGICFGGTNPVIITSIGDLYAESREATGQGLRFAASGLTQTVFPLVSGALVVAAWQYPFLLYTAAVPIAALVYLWFEEPSAEGVGAGDDGDTDADSDAGTDDADDGTTAGTDGDGAEGSYARALLSLLGRRRTLAVVVGRSLPMVVWVGFITYNSFIVVDLLDGTPPQAGLLVAVGSLAFAVAGSQAGRITAAFDSRFYPLAGASVCLAGGFAATLVAPGLAVAAVAVAVTGVGFGVALSLYRSLVTGLAPESLRSGLVSVAEAGGRIAATLTPLGMGAIIAVTGPTLGHDAAIRAAGLAAAAVGGGGGLLCLLVARAAPPVPAERAQSSTDGVDVDADVGE